MTLNLRLVFCSHFLEVFWGRFLLDIQHKNFELSVCVAWTVRVTEIFLYTKVYSFGGNKALLRVKRTFELSEFELSRFYCIKILRTEYMYIVGMYVLRRD